MAAKSIVYYGAEINNWSVTYNDGDGRQPDYGYTIEPNVGTIYFQVLQTGGVLFSNPNNISIAGLSYFNFGMHFTACDFAFTLSINNGTLVSVSGLQQSIWNNVSLSISEFNLQSPYINSISLVKTDATACDAWIGDVFFNDGSDPIYRVATSQFVTSGTSTSSTSSGSTGSQSSTASSSTSTLSTTGGESIPCAKNIYRIWDGQLENGWIAEYFSGSGRAPDGLVMWESQNVINFLVQQWGGLTLRINDNSYTDISKYTYINYKLYWEDTACNFTTRNRLKTGGAIWSNYMDFDNMQRLVWNQVSVPLANLSLPNEMANQFEVAKTDLYACNAYVADVYFADGIYCSSSSIISFSLILMVAALFMV